MFLPRTIATTIDGIARKTIGKDWNLYAALLSHWPEIVGEDYARSTTPVKISFPKGKTPDEKWAHGKREDGVLHIRLPQGLTMEFTFKTDQIRQRISDYFGYNAIARIVFEPFYGEAKTSAAKTTPPTADEIATLREQTNAIENNELRDALEAFGVATLSKK